MRRGNGMNLREERRGVLLNDKLEWVGYDGLKSSCWRYSEKEGGGRKHMIDTNGRS